MLHRLLKYKVTPSGDINGVNKTFILSSGYESGKLTVYLNGLEEKNFVETDSPNGIFDLNEAPLLGDEIVCYYVKE